MHMHSIIVAGVLTVCTLTAGVQARPDPAPAAAPGDKPVITTDQWKQDLAELAKELPKRHLNAFFKTPREEFEKAVQELDARLAELDTPATVMGFARLAAMLHDAHTSVDISKFTTGYKRFPIGCMVLSDGVLITASTADKEALRGMVIKSIDGVPIDQAIDKVSTLYGWENRALKLHRAREFLNLAQALRVAGVTKSDDTAEFEISDPKTGSVRKETLTSISPAGVRFEGIKITPAGPAELTFQRRGAALWWDMLPNTRCLYVRYDRCANDQNKTIAQYTDELNLRIDKGGLAKIIIDLRYNGGGDSALLDGFISRLASRSVFKTRGTVVVLIGRGTQSSAQLNAVALRKRAGAVLVGGPTGQKPNAFGELKSFELPNSKMKVWYSTKLFKTEDGDPESTMPDFDAEQTVMGQLEGRDLGAEAAVKVIEGG